MTTKTETCHDCGAVPGELHQSGCDVERCPNCGRQAISCGCSDELYFERRMPWTGEWPASAECREYGLYAKFDEAKGRWIKCEASDPEAGPDLNTLVTSYKWDRERQKWVPRA